ncbi:MAG: flagellar export chaperone FliS [Clostridiales bacterium]|nr:flagellar export chaperone FliS [Clostridiales bacterium]
MIEKEYLANRIANANDAQLVAILHEGLMSTAKSGIEHIENGNKKELNSSVNKIREILAELLATTEGDSEIAGNLRSIYVYLNKLATEAEIQQDKAKLEEAIKVVTPIYEAWQELGEKEVTENDDSQTTSTPAKTPSIVAGMTYGKGELNDYVINDEDRWEKG